MNTPEEWLIAIGGFVGIAFILAIGLGIPILAIARENSGKLTKRREFLLWLAAFLATPEIAWYLLDLGGHQDLADYAEGIVLLVLIYPFFQRITRRARDAGMGKAIAYWSMVPPVTLPAWVALLYLPSVKMNDSA